MASLHMGGCYPLTDEKIDEEVTRTEPGNLALGYLDGGTFIVFYVGRSDSDVNESLHSWVGVDGTSSRYCSCAKAAYGPGRRCSPDPLNAPALQAVGIVVDGRYTHFELGYAPSAEAAFENECRNYHDFGGSYGLDNEQHQVAPEGYSWECPLRGCHHG